MSGPLSGFRVVDLTNVISGPMATQILGDQGADIVKIEARGGDLTRGGGNRQGGLSAAFLNNNRNKRSVVLDLKQPEGVALLKRLAATADVFIQNFRPGVVERLGVGEADVRAVRPDIVYVSISGFGEKGPFASKPTYDPIVQAISGLTTVQAGSDEERPRLVRTILPDKVTALTAAQAVTAALLHRAATGEGQHVRVSMLDSVVAFLWNSDMGSQTFVDAPVSIQRAASFIDLIYETADGFMSVSLMTDRQWLGFCEVAGREDLAADPRFATSALRDENIDARLEQVQKELRKRTHGGVDCRVRRGKRALCGGADPQRDGQAPAGGGQRHAGGIRPPACRTAAAGEARRPLRGFARRHKARRVRARRGHARGAGGSGRGRGRDRGGHGQRCGRSGRFLMR